MAALLPWASGKVIHKYRQEDVMIKHGKLWISQSRTTLKAART
jgi:hypothetical protein